MADVDALIALMPKFDPTTYAALGRQNALTSANQSAGTLAASGDLEGARNSLLRAGFPDQAKYYRDWSDADDQSAALGRVADAYSAGNVKSGATEALRAGLPNVASGLWNLQSQQTNLANNAEDRAKASAKDALSGFANAARLATTDDEYNRVLDYAKAHGLSDADDYRGTSGRALLYGRAGIAGDVADQQAKAAAAQSRVSTQPGIAGPMKMQDDFRRQYGAELPWAVANEAWKEGHTPVLNSDGSIGYQAHQAGTRAATREATTQFRQQAQDPALQAQLSEYKKLGQEDAGLAQRKSIASGALNHLETVEQISDNPAFENAIGVIQGNGGYQRFLDSANSGRLETSAAYRNAKQTLAVLEREVGNAYHIAGTGADTDTRLKTTQEAFSDLMNSPNVGVFKERLANIRAILQGVINSSRPSQFGSMQPQTAGSGRAEEEARRVSGATENNGQIARSPVQSDTPPVPGARRSPNDGHWYVQGPDGRYLRIDQ